MPDDARDPSRRPDPSELDRAIPWLAGRRLALLGKLGGLGRRDAKAWLARHGATVGPLSDERLTDVIVGADSFPFNLRELNDAVLQRIEASQVQLWEETEFWQRCGLLDRDSTTVQLYTPAMLADLLGVPVRTVRRWHQLGLLQPVKEVCRLPYFDFQELAAARRLAKWLQTSSPEHVEAQLVKLLRVLPAAQRSLSQLPLIVQGNQVLLRQMAGLVDPNGQLRFDFDALEHNEAGPGHDGDEAHILTIREVPGGGSASPSGTTPRTDWSEFKPQSPEDCLQQAIEYEDAQDWSSAIHVYRSMQLAFGPSADLCFQIGELLYRGGELAAARERYSMAVELDPEFLEARANLGCVLMELEQWDLALAAFEGALNLHPDYADVLFHAASTCEKLGRVNSAQDYWQRFLKAAPNSPWAPYAAAKVHRE